MTSVGILGIGVFLPPTVRTNHSWPEHVIGSWRSGAAAEGRTTMPAAEVAGEGARKVAATMAAYIDDPFQGSRERRVLAPHLQPSDMETEAARSAIRQAGLEAGDIDFILQDSMVPDDLLVPGGCIVHERLGLAERCLTLSTSATCNAFALQMELSHALISTGNYRYGLLIQSNAVSRLIPMHVRYSPWFGDGATAVIVGPVGRGSGLLGSAHWTDGSLCDAMVASVPGQRWYDDGRIWWHPRNHASAHRMLTSVADQARHAITAVLERAEIAMHQVDFYASHQATAWFRAVTQEHAGLNHARSLDTFPWAGSLGAANIPLVLSVAQERGLIREGELIVTFSGGSGITWSSVALRWGR